MKEISSILKKNHKILKKANFSLKNDGKLSFLGYREGTPPRLEEASKGIHKIQWYITIFNQYLLICLILLKILQFSRMIWKSLWCPRTVNQDAIYFLAGKFQISQPPAPSHGPEKSLRHHGSRPPYRESPMICDVNTRKTLQNLLYYLRINLWILKILAFGD